MKSLTEKIYESINDTTLTGSESCDMFTREYNNLFANMSNTLLRKVDVLIDRPVYVLTGSALRTGCDFLYSGALAVTTLGRTMTPSEFLSERGYCIYDPDGSNKCISACPSDGEDDILDPMIVSAVADMVKDCEYLIVA